MTNSHPKRSIRIRSIQPRRTLLVPAMDSGRAGRSRPGASAGALGEGHQGHPRRLPQAGDGGLQRQRAVHLEAALGLPAVQGAGAAVHARAGVPQRGPAADRGAAGVQAEAAAIRTASDPLRPPPTPTDSLPFLVPQVRLVFKQKRLQFEPPLEEIRTAHYKQVKAFLNLPLTHKVRKPSYELTTSTPYASYTLRSGVSVLSEKPGFFKPMVDRSARGVARVYEHAEVLFARLAEEQKKLVDWVALGTVDLEEFCMKHMDEVADWETNIRMLKEATRAAEKLPLEVKVDCYNVSLQPVKQTIDDQLKQLQDALVNSLRLKAQAEKEEVESFMQDGKSTLEVDAQSVDEIGNARSKARSLKGSVQRMMLLRRRVDEKNKLLKAVMGAAAAAAAGGLVDTSAMTNEWENFTTKLEKHESHLEEQKNVLKQKVDKTISDFQGK
eukprot:851759-Prorocentrum_minimum.AAC.1